MMEELDIDAVKEKLFEMVAKIAQKRPLYQEMSTTVYAKILNEEEQAVKNVKIVDYKSTVRAVPHRSSLDIPVTDGTKKTYNVESIKNYVASLNKDNCTVSKIVNIFEKEAQVAKARSASKESTRWSSMLHENR